MKCPFCGKEMEEGKIRPKGGCFFLPDGCRAPHLYSEHSMKTAGAVALNPSVFDAHFESCWPKALLCSTCRKMIVDY